MIEQTEALVSIDVNGGHCMLGQGTSQEKAILEVNLAAAKQVLSNSIKLLALFYVLIVVGKEEWSMSFLTYMHDEILSSLC